LNDDSPDLFESRVDARDETVLDHALTTWFPTVYRLPASIPATGTTEVKEQIADLSKRLAIAHHDWWLKEFSAYENHPQFPSAVRLLAQTIKENQSGHPDEALIQAHHVRLVFRKMHNIAGQRRAEFEEIYALERLARSQECLQRLEQTERLVAERRFPWLKIQLLLEKSTCVGRRKQMEESMQYATRAAAIAQRVGYEVLALRALGMLAELKATMRDDEDAWRLAQDALRQFWRGRFPPMRGYQFYGTLGYSAEYAAQWQLATALNVEAVGLAAQTGNISVEAMARYRLGGDALMAGDTALAARELQRADALFAALPQTEARRTYSSYSKIVLAGLEAHRDKLDRSRDLLEHSTADVANSDDFIIQLSYYQTNGELQWKNGQKAEAEKSFLAALQICRAWLGHSPDTSDRLGLRTLVGNIYRDLIEIQTENNAQPDITLALWEEFRWLFATPPAAGGLSPSWSSANGLAEKLRTFHDRSLLTLVQFQDGIGIWLADDRGISFKKIQLNSLDLERKVRHFHTLCSRPNSDQNAIRTTGKELYDLLIAPFASRLELNRILLIDADDFLKNVPFQALVDDRGHYFGQAVSIISSPGLPFEMEFGRQDETALFAKHASFLAPPVPPNLATELLPLKDAIREARLVAGHFRQPTLLLENEATAEALQKAIMNSTSLYFAGHAVFKNGQVGLVLAARGQNGTGAAEAEIFSSENLKKGISLSLRLVVLAACSTATSGDDDLYSRRNLAQAFLQAGVAHVIASHWDVDSEATGTLMEEFFSELAAGKPVAESLRGAQAVVSSRRGMSHPYYWAAFSAAGGS
jgi:CHAT domain-containing protein